MYYYLNEDHSIRECTHEEWANQFEDMRKNDTKHIAEDIIDNKLISTVWLGLDHNYFGGPPQVFETMIFGQNKETPESLGEDIYMQRYSTWGEAVKGHNKALQWVKDGCKDD